MRALTVCALASLLSLVPVTNARGQMAAQAFAPGEMPVQVDAPTESVGASADHGIPVPRPTISSDATHPTNDRFTVRVNFSEAVDGFEITEVRVENGTTVSDLTGSGTSYRFDVRPNANFEGDVIVTIPAGVAQSVANDENNVGERESFAVDTRAPRLQSATVDNDELVLDYDEDLDNESVPDESDFNVTAGRTVAVSRVRIRADKVTLELASPVARGATVRLDYDVPNRDAIRDEVGNEADDLSNEPVTNNTDSNGELPGAPRSLTATADGRTAIDLAWRRPSTIGASAITGYRIEVSNDAGGTWEILERDTDDTGTTYEDSPLEPGTTRHYRVFAINSRGQGPGSNVASATTEGGLPGAPRNLRARANGRTEIDLTWDPPSDAGSADITGYKIEVSRNAGDSWIVRVENTRSSRTTYTHSGLDSGTRRHYRVSAINAAGTGPVSNVDDATTDIGVPRAPTRLTATADGESRIRLRWTAPSDNGGARISGYRIEVSLTGTGGWDPLESNSRSTSTSYTDSGLSPGSKRYYRVAAINSEGTGAFSRVAHATTRAALPGAPTDLTAKARGTTQIDLTWLAPSSDGGASIIGYRVESSSDGDEWTVVRANTNSTSTTFSDTNLSPGTTRHYRVFAVNLVGAGPASHIARATTDATVPRAPTGLSARADGRSRIDLSWTRPSYDGGAAIIGYQIEVSSNSGSTWSVHVPNTRSTSTAYAHSPLEAGTTWHYRVSAINSVGTSNPSNVASATTELDAPGAPTGLTAAADGISQMRLSWTAPADDGGARITGYRIEVSLTGAGEWTVLAYHSQSTSTSYTHRGLLPGSRRHYRVAAINSEGTGAYSNVAVGSTRATVPGAPAGLTATAGGQTRIDLAWRAPRSDGGAPVTGYRIEVSADRSTWTTLDDNTNSIGTTFSHTGLEPATTRHYRVSAINSAGRGPASNVARATTDATVPAEPTGLSARANGQSRIDLSWTRPSNDGGAAVTGYRIESSADGGGTWTELRDNTNSTATAFSHTGLTPATTMHYRVYAINKVGRGPASNVASATTDATVPASPTNLAAVANGTSQIDLSWSAPGYDGGSAITGYRIQAAWSSSGPWSDLVTNTGSTAATYSHTGLEPATTRYYRVYALNRVGAGRASGVASATTDATVPDAPINLVAVATEPTRIDLTWVAPLYDGGAAVTSYRIEVSENAGGAWRDLVASTGVTATAYGDTGLQPGTTRHYRVSAINMAGTGAPSNVAFASTDDPVQRAGRVNAEVLPHAVAAMTASTLSAISGRIEAVAAGVPYGRQTNMGTIGSLFGGAALNRGARQHGLSDVGLGRDLGAGALLDGASFVLPVGNAQQEGGIPNIAAWGSGEYHNLSRPRGGVVDWDGEVLSVHAGADVQLRWDLLVGLAATRSNGTFDFTDETGNSPVDGTYQNAMTAVNPYVAWFLGRGGVVAWATAGYGWGDVEIEDDRQEMRRSGTRMTSAAVGASGNLLASGGGKLRVRTEGWMSQVKVDGSEEVDSLTLAMRRARVSLEWEQAFRFDSGHEVAALVEGGVRYDDGDGGNGEGGELGGGLRYVSPGARLIVEGRGRVLTTGHTGYEEWGASGLVQFDMHRRGEGLSVRLTPGWGEASGGVRQLWDHGVANRAGLGRTPARARLDGEVEYGLSSFRGTPYGRLYLADGGDRAFGSGVRYEIGRVLDLRIEGTRREHAVNGARHGLTMKGHWKF